MAAMEADAFATFVRGTNTSTQYMITETTYE